MNLYDIYQNGDDLPFKILISMAICHSCYLFSKFPEEIAIEPRHRFEPRNVLGHPGGRKKERAVTSSSQNIMVVCSDGKIVNSASWWFGTFFLFPYIGIYWEESSQLTNIFSEGLKPPTRIVLHTQYWYSILHVIANDS